MALTRFTHRAIGPLRLAAKEVHTAPPKARAATPITLANFATKTPINANRPSFFATTRADQRRDAIFSDMVGRGVEVLIAFAGGVRECGQQLLRRLLVGIDAARTRQQIKAEIAFATERISIADGQAVRSCWRSPMRGCFSTCSICTGLATRRRPDHGDSSARAFG
jgi:hypothetical protein